VEFFSNVTLQDFWSIVQKKVKDSRKKLECTGFGADLVAGGEVFAFLKS
jgi:hypothetical protein